VSKLLLDTNICVLILCSREVVTAHLQKSIENKDEIFLSAVVLFELEFGVANSHPDHRNRHAAKLREFKAGPLINLPFTPEDAIAAANIRQRLKHKPIGGYDLLIAGQAINGGFTIVTGDTSEFFHIAGLHLLNWSK
jgi:tRNA(fMet)-specific endonuclease VapC